MYLLLLFLFHRVSFITVLISTPLIRVGYYFTNLRRHFNCLIEVSRPSNKVSFLIQILPQGATKRRAL